MTLPSHRTVVSLAAIAGSVLAFASLFPAWTSPAYAQRPVPSETGLLTGASSPLRSGLEALERSNYRAAREHLERASRGADAQVSWLALARLALLEGKHDEAINCAKEAERRGGPGRLEAAVLLARALAGQGKVEEAIAAVRKVEGVVEARLARVVLGELLILSGDSAGARGPLMSLVQDYNDDKITDRDGDDLALVGRAAHLLRSASDANDAYNKAERAGAKSSQMLLWRAELFLEKYDTGHAEEVLTELLKHAPDHPDALVLMAQVKLEQTYDFASAERLVSKALAVNPGHTGAHFVRAGISLRDFSIALADAAVTRGLQTNPHDLDLLSMRAAIRFLAEDKAGFALARNAVLKRNPQYSRMYQIVSEYAEWEHRYQDIVDMMRDAVQVNRRDGKAWSVLGLNLIRLGEDDAGVDALRKSWQFDRFNVRVYNILNLFEKDIPSQYETVQFGNYRYRFNKKESALLARYVPSMMDEAFSSMERRYSFTPLLPVGIELYSDSEHFSVRTSGLPAVGIQGVCFGRTLASMSPKGANFNWGNVLWHELAHVFAIQLSQSRVPRWFTEGLSEYETFLRHSDWQREEDMLLYSALKANRLPKVASFNRAFTHARGPEDMSVAYYAASQMIVYIGERYGMQKLVDMLRHWGQGLRDPVVVRSALGISTDELDSQFRVWLAPRLARYDKQFVPDLWAPPLEEAEQAAKAAPQDTRAQLDLLLAQLSEGQASGAKAKLEAFAKSHPKDPLIGYIRARFLAESKNLDGARRVLEELVASGHDGYAVRLRLGDIAEAKKDAKLERTHLEAARRYDPTQAEPLQGLYDLAKKEKRKGDMLAALRELSLLDQHHPRVAVLLLDMLVEAELWEEARRVGARAIYVDLHNAIVHRLYGQALAEGGQHDRAIFELESAVLCEPEDKEAAKIFLLAARVYRKMGRLDDSRKAVNRVLDLDPDNAEAGDLARDLAR